MAIKEPVIFCQTYPTFSAGDEIEVDPGVFIDGRVRLPFDLGEINYDTSCKGLHLSVPNLNLSMQMVLPIFKIADCILKVVDVLNAVFDALGPPPKPHKMIEALSGLTDCINLMLKFTFVGTAIIDICIFLRDLIRFVIAVLICVRNSLTIYLESEAEATALSASADPRLQEMGACLTVQNAALKKELEMKLGGVSLILEVVNIILGVVSIPGVSTVGTSTTLSISPLNDMIAALKVVLVPLEACAGP